MFEITLVGVCLKLFSHFDRDFYEPRLDIWISVKLADFIKLKERESLIDSRRWNWFFQTFLIFICPSSSYVGDACAASGIKILAKLTIRQRLLF